MSTARSIKSAAGLTAVLALVGCAGGQRVPDGPAVAPVAQLSAPIKYYSDDNTVIAESLGRELVLSFPLIRGRMFGTPESEPVVTARVPDDKPLEIDLHEYEETLRDNARTLSEGAQTRGLVAEPPDVRLARIGTFAYSARTRANWPAGFMNERVRSMVILVYFDRGCRLYGSARMEEDVYRYDVRVSESGAYWIMIERIGRHEFRLRALQAESDISFAVFPTNMLLTAIMGGGAS